MSKEMSLVVLSDRKDETVYMVPPFVMSWINQPYDHSRSRYGYNEKLPSDVLAFFKESAKDNDFVDEDDIMDTVEVTVGSTNNDRALQVIVADSFEFGSEVDAIAHAKENDIVINDVYHGVCY